MKEKIKTVKAVMNQLGVTVEDLLQFDDDIDRTGHFPLELYYNDGSKSAYRSYFGNNRSRITPIGVVIADTVYAFSTYHWHAVKADSCEMKCRKYCNGSGTLPTTEQLKALYDNIDAYNRIHAYFALSRLRKNGEVAIAHENNSAELQYTYDHVTGAERTQKDNIFVLPVVNL